MLVSVVVARGTLKCVQHGSLGILQCFLDFVDGMIEVFLALFGRLFNGFLDLLNGFSKIVASRIDLLRCRFVATGGDEEGNHECGNEDFLFHDD